MFSYLIAVGISLLLLAVHLLGVDGLYYRLPELDILSHGIGGLALGFFIYGLVVSFMPRVVNIRTTVVLGTLLVAAIWEAFELYYGITGHPPGTRIYVIDTIKDLVIGTICGYVAVWVAVKIQNRLSSNQISSNEPQS